MIFIDLFLFCKFSSFEHKYCFNNYDQYKFLFFIGKTRTKDKYRVVYTDQQRLELEKEYHYTRYITIRRKSELSQVLGLTERQVKIWVSKKNQIPNWKQV